MVGTSYVICYGGARRAYPILIQNSSNLSSPKKFEYTTVRPHKVFLLTCVVNSTAGTPSPRLCSVVQWSVHWAPSRTTRVLVLAGARRCALETCGKKNASSAFRLGQIYILVYTQVIRSQLFTTLETILCETLLKGA